MDTPGYKRPRSLQPPEITLTTHSMHTPFAPIFCVALFFLTNDESRPTSSTHRLSSTTTPLHVDLGNLKTSEPKASETLCARITSLPESRPQPRLRPAPHALRALACATTAHVPSCARARARVGRACARAISCSCPCHLVLVLVCSCAPSRPSGGWLLRWLAASVAGRFGG